MTPDSAYWRHVALVLMQYEGIIAAYTFPQKLTNFLSFNVFSYNQYSPFHERINGVPFMLYFLQFELDDISASLKLNLPHKVLNGSHCSVLIKVFYFLSLLSCSHGRS